MSNRPPAYILPRFNKNENTNLAVHDWHCSRSSKKFSSNEPA